MRNLKIAIAASLAFAATAEAAGPLRTTDAPDVKPIGWDTSNGPIPVYTDGGEVFTYDFDGVTPFVTIERANEVTEYAFQQWSNVSSSTFEAQIMGTIEEQIGLADVTSETADQVYFTENGYGFWVVYDTDGSILSDLFGVSPTSVLGIAFPEFGTADGEITEATALMNGYAVNVNDPNLDQYAGVFTHEFGHAINLAHTQVNGHIAYFGSSFAPLYPGVADCGEYPSLSSLEQIETMYPFIDSSGPAGTAQSTVNHPDDVASISNLYPTADYHANTGSITGVLRLKDGSTEFSGVNVVARNINNLFDDAVSALSGDQTQGKVGPDGSYTLHNLTPGEEYVVYIERIINGGYSTTPQRPVSQSEYWNENESNDPSVDDVCEATPILAEAGVTKQADITFNGFTKGIQYTPLVDAFLTDLSKNGKKSAGVAGQTSFIWDENKQFVVLPPEIVGANGSMNRNGQVMTVSYDSNGNGIQEPHLFDFQGSKKGRLVPLGDLNGDTCGGSGSAGVNSTSLWAVDDAGHNAVGLAYKDVDGNGSCQSSFNGEIVPYLWNKKSGATELDWSGLDYDPQFVRAHAISGNGRVALGVAGFGHPVAWVDAGPMIILEDHFDAYDAYATSYDGSRIAVQTLNDGVVLFNPYNGAQENIGGLRWCRDMPYRDFLGRDLCALVGEDVINDQLGPIPVLPSDMTDSGDIIIGRAGSFRTGIVGAIWIEALGWFPLDKFLREQAVSEAADVPMDNPLSISANGTRIMGGLAGVSSSWLMELDQVWVCQDGQSSLTAFPGGMVQQVENGAVLGHCDFIE